MPRRPNLERRVMGPYYNKATRKWGYVIVTPIRGAKDRGTTSEGAGQEGTEGAGKKKRDALVDKEWFWDDDSEDDANANIQRVLKNWARLDTHLLDYGIRQYLHQYKLAHPKRDTWEDIEWRLKLFFGSFDVISHAKPDPERIKLSDVMDMRISSFTTDDLQRRFTAVCWAISPKTKKLYATDTHHGLLKEVKAFFTYCVKQKWIASNPASPIEYEVPKKKGKAQYVNHDDAWLWLETALDFAYAPEPNPTKAELAELISEYSLVAIARHYRVSDVAVRKWAIKYDLLEMAKAGGQRKGTHVPEVEGMQWAGGRGRLPGITPQGALAALMTFIFAARAGEVTQRLVQCVDKGGAVLHIREYDYPEQNLFWQPKSQRGNRDVAIPELIRPAVLKLTKGRDRLAPLFLSNKTGTFFHRHWVNKQVLKICKVAGLMKVTAHGMRGMHGTLTAPHVESIDILVGLFGQARDGQVMRSGAYATDQALAEQKLRKVWEGFEEYRLRKQQQPKPAQKVAAEVIKKRAVG